MEPLAVRQTVALCSLAMMYGYPVTRRDRRHIYRDYASKDEKNRLDDIDEKRRSARKAARSSRKRNRSR